MAGNKQKKSFSFFRFFKARRGCKDQDYSYSAEVVSSRYSRDEDNPLGVVPEPAIDKKASIFIANFHATCVSEAIHHIRPTESEAAPSYEPSSPLYRSG